jgi:hypothetical protein
MNFKIKKTNGYFSLKIIFKKQTVRGITSLCQDGKHIIMLDYDNVCRWIVEKELKELSKNYGTFYLFTTKQEKIDGDIVGNYHAIGLEKHTSNEIIQIHNQTSCDQAYTTMPLRNRFRSWVLRTSYKKGSNKPKYISTIGLQFNLKESSNAHLLLLINLYPNIILKSLYKKTDNYIKLYKNEYETNLR